MMVSRNTIGAVAVLLLAGLWAGWASAADECHLTRAAEFTFAPSSTARVGIPVGIDGYEEMFLVDTGGAISMIAAATAQKLDLHQKAVDPNVVAVTADGTRLDHYVSVSTLAIGPAQLHRRNLLVWPGSKEDPSLGGTLAPDVLGIFDLDFDFAAHHLNFFLQKHCPGHVVYWASHYGTVPFTSSRVEGWIRVKVQLDGKDVGAILDTGASDTVLGAGQAESLFGIVADSLEKTMADGRAITPPDLGVHRFNTLSFGDVTVGDPSIVITRDAAQEAYERHNRGNKLLSDPLNGPTAAAMPLVIGMNVLSKLHLYIAYGEKMLYVTAAGTGQAPPPPAGASN